jgi:hypothetical protein
MYPDDSQLGEPKLYADYDVDHWLIKPSPNDYPFEALVWRLPDLLSPSNQTNYLTDYAPNLLLLRRCGAVVLPQGSGIGDVLGEPCREALR